MVRQPIVPEFTGEEYLRWELARPEKYERHVGFIVSFAGGTLRHNQIALAMHDVLENKLPSCATFAIDVKTRIEENAYSYPDVVVVCGEVDDRGGMGGAWRTTCYDDEIRADVYGIDFLLDEIYGPMHAA